MDVDASSKGVAIVGITATEPEDTGNDGVAAGRVGRDDGAGPTSAFEDCSYGGAVSDFFGDDVGSQGGAITSALAAQSEF